MEPGSVRGVPSVEVFLRDPSSYLREFWRNHGILRTVRPGIELGTKPLSALSAKQFLRWWGSNILQTKSLIEKF